MKIIHSGEDEGGWSDEDKQKYRYCSVHTIQFYLTSYTHHAIRTFRKIGNIHSKTIT